MSTFLKIESVTDLEPFRKIGYKPEFTIPGLYFYKDKRIIHFQQWKKENLHERERNVALNSVIDVKIIDTTDLLKISKDHSYLVAHIRHKLCNYQKLVKKINKTNEDCYYILKLRTINKIRQAYPFLAKTCYYQMLFCKPNIIEYNYNRYILVKNKGNRITTIVHPSGVACNFKYNSKSELYLFGFDPMKDEIKEEIKEAFFYRIKNKT